MCEALSGVNWFELGIQLGLKHSRLRDIEIENPRDVSRCKIDMIAAWLKKKDHVAKKGGPTCKQLAEALRVIGEIGLSEEIGEIMKQKLSSTVKSTKEKSRRDLSTDEKRSVKKRKKEMKKRRKSSDTDSDNEERGETHRYKKRKIESGSDSSDNDDKEEMTSKVKRKRIESSFDSHESTNIKKRRLESSDSDSELEYQSDYHSNHTKRGVHHETHEDVSYENRIIKKRSKRRKDKHVSRSKKQRMDLDERSVASKVQGKGPASGKPYKRKRVPKNKTDSESEHDDSDSEPSSKRR